MRALGLFDEVHDEVGHIIVASVNAAYMKALLQPDEAALRQLIAKRGSEGEE
jgi:hypothetical protein